jgi:hypothetical protein
MNVDLPEVYNAATTFVDENIKQGRGGKVAIYYKIKKSPTSKSSKTSIAQATL